MHLMNPEEINENMVSTAHRNAKANSGGQGSAIDTRRVLDKQGDLIILSWNIHDAMTKDVGPKSEDGDFLEVLTKSSIFCLQETKNKRSSFQTTNASIATGITPDRVAFVLAYTALLLTKYNGSRRGAQTFKPCQYSETILFRSSPSSTPMTLQKIHHIKQN